MGILFSISKENHSKLPRRGYVMKKLLQYFKTKLEDYFEAHPITAFIFIGISSLLIFLSLFMDTSYIFVFIFVVLYFVLSNKWSKSGDVLRTEENREVLHLKQQLAEVEKAITENPASLVLIEQREELKKLIELTIEEKRQKK